MAAEQHSSDLLGELAQIMPDSELGQLRAQHKDLVQHVQQAYKTLFEPSDLAGISQSERELIGLRVALNANATSLAEHYRQRLLALGTPADTLQAVEQFPQGAVLSPRQTAFLTHIDKLAFTPAQAQAADLAPLRAVGLSDRDCVVFTQIISFVSFQTRVSHGLRALAEAEQSV